MFGLHQWSEQWTREETQVKLLEASSRPATEPVARMLGCKPGERTLFLRRLLVRDSEPITYNWEYLVFDPRRPLVETQLRVTSLEGLLQSAAGPAMSGRLKITAYSLTLEEARLLDQAEGAAALRLEHLFTDVTGAPISWGCFLCKADVFWLETDMGTRKQTEGGQAVDHVEALTTAIVEMDEEAALSIVADLLDAGAGRSAIVQAANAALEIVGERYERKEYFLSALIVGGEIFKRVIGVFGPESLEQQAGVRRGEGPPGDGRRRSARHRQEHGGHRVHRARLRGARPGRRCPERSQFVEEVRDFEPDILGLSGILIPTAATAMRKTVEAVRADRAEAGGMPFVIIGGRVDQAIADYVRSDTWTTDAMEGGRICQRFMESQKTVTAPVVEGYERRRTPGPAARRLAQRRGGLRLAAG